MPLLSNNDSSNFPDLKSSIENSKENRLEIRNMSIKVNIDDKLIINDENILAKYKNLISNYLIDINITDKELYHPEYVSKRIYGTNDLWYLVLMVNNVSSMYNFSSKKIKVFDPTKIYILNEIIENNSKKLDRYKKDPIYLEDSTIKKVGF